MRLSEGFTGVHGGSRCVELGESVDRVKGGRRPAQRTLDAGRRVRFEDYDLPDLKTVNHIFTTADERCAWFADTEGNILCIHEETRKPH
jgi:hypothetical protein